MMFSPIDLVALGAGLGLLTLLGAVLVSLTRRAPSGGATEVEGNSQTAITVTRADSESRPLASAPCSDSGLTAERLLTHLYGTTAGRRSPRRVTRGSARRSRRVLSEGREQCHR